MSLASGGANSWLNASPTAAGLGMCLSFHLQEEERAGWWEVRVRCQTEEGLKNTLSLPAAGALHLGGNPEMRVPPLGVKIRVRATFAARQLSFCHLGKIPVSQSLFVLPLL